MLILKKELCKTRYSKNNLLIDHFEKTGLIRPDSLGIFMSNFESSQVSTTDGSIELTVWNPEPDDSIEIIKDIVPKTLDFMSSYLATRFPTNKLDIVVVPSTDITTAESPGLIVIESVEFSHVTTCYRIMWVF